MEVREAGEELRALGASALAVGFSPRDPLAALAVHLEWPWPFLSDTERILYQRLGIRRASLREVYSAGTLRRYADAARSGVRVRRPVEDTRQLGADAVVLDGAAEWVYRPRTPDDRPTAAQIIDAVRSLLRPGGRAPV